MAKKTLTETVNDARGAGTPLLVVQTADQIAAISAICNSSNGAPKVLWDAARGVQGLNPAGVQWVKTFGSPDEVRQSSANPQTALEMAEKLPEDGMFFALNFHRFIEDAFVSTGTLNLREPYKTNGRTFIGTCPAITLPAELRQDVVVIDDPLPDDDQLRVVAEKLLGGAGLKEDDEKTARILDALRGLSPFAAEQVLAMSLRKSGVDMDSLWERKRMQVAQVKGLRLVLDGPTFTDTGGNAQLLADLTDIMQGEEPPVAICWWDEMEKSGAADKGLDSSNVVADFRGAFLNWMEESGHDGVIFVGGAGTGKSLAAKSIGPQFGKPTFIMDPGGMKGKFVGDSEQAHREAFRTINSVARGRVFVVATCNKLADVPAEIRRRFASGIYYVDLPSLEERRAITRVQLKAHGLDLALEEAVLGVSEQWTGAEIRNLCRMVKRQRITVAAAAAKIVPVAVSDPKSIEDLRTLAEGKFLSANYPGTYSRSRVATTDTERRVRVKES